MEIIKLLEAQHREVESMFKEFEKLGERAFSTKQELARKICLALEVHTTIEEALFYPELETAAATADLVREAYIEHTSAKDLIAQIKASKAEAEDFDARVKVLKDMIEHHVGEEEDELMPAARDVLGKERLDAMGEEAESMKAREFEKVGVEVEDQPSA